MKKEKLFLEKYFDFEIITQKGEFSAAALLDRKKIEKNHRILLTFCVFWGNLTKHDACNKYRGIAQLVEQRSPKPRAEGSKPSAPAK